MRARRNGLQAKRCLSVLIAVLLALPFGAAAQQTPAPAPATAPIQPAAPLPTVNSLKVAALAGNGEKNDLERKVMAPLVVQVMDLQDRPIEGAEVIFRFPLRGPTVTFADGKNTKTVRTNSQGEAAATGWMANNELGTFQIHATATYGNQFGETTITMANVQRLSMEELNRTGKRKGLWSSKWFKIALIAGGAGAVAGIVLATRGGGGTPAATTSTITVSPGSPSVGGPP